VRRERRENSGNPVALKKVLPSTEIAEFEIKLVDWSSSFKEEVDKSGCVGGERNENLLLGRFQNLTIYLYSQLPTYFSSSNNMSAKDVSGSHCLQKFSPSSINLDIHNWFSSKSSSCHP